MRVPYDGQFAPMERAKVDRVSTICSGVSEKYSMWANQIIDDINNSVEIQKLKAKVHDDFAALSIKSIAEARELADLFRRDGITDEEFRAASNQSWTEKVPNTYTLSIPLCFASDSSPFDFRRTVGSSVRSSTRTHVSNRESPLPSAIVDDILHEASSQLHLTDDPATPQQSSDPNSTTEGDQPIQQTFNHESPTILAPPNNRNPSMAPVTAGTNEPMGNEDLCLDTGSRKISPLYPKDLEPDEFVFVAKEKPGQKFVLRCPDGPRCITFKNNPFTNAVEGVRHIKNHHRKTHGAKSLSTWNIFQKYAVEGTCYPTTSWNIS